MASRSPVRFSSTKLLASLRRVGQEEGSVPDGFRNRWEWAKVWGISHQHTGKLISGGLQAGLMVMKKIRRKSFDGRVRPIPYYAEKPAGV